MAAGAVFSGGGFSPAIPARSPMTRIPLLVLCLSALAGCSGAPPVELTGAPAAIPPVGPSDATTGLPGVQRSAGPYTPSFVPSTGGGRYFGYHD